MTDLRPDSDVRCLSEEGGTFALPYLLSRQTKEGIRNTVPRNCRVLGNR
jgi:hypothetical protein